MSMTTKKYRGFEITRGNEPTGNYWTVIKNFVSYGMYLSEMGAKIRIDQIKNSK